MRRRFYNGVKVGKFDPKRTQVVEFDTIREVLAYGPMGLWFPEEFPKPIPIGKPNHKHSYLDKDEFGYGDVPFHSGKMADGLDGYKNMLREFSTTGWKDGAKAIEEFKTKAYARIPDPKRVAPELETQRLFGSKLDVHRYLGGNRDCFGRWQQELNSGTRNVRLIVISSLRSNETQDQAFMSAKVMLALAEKLEQAGYFVSIDAVSAAYQESSNSCSFRVLHVKEPRDPLNTAKSAAMCGTAAVYRSGVFGGGLCADFSIDGGFGPTIVDIDKENLVNLGVVERDEKCVFVRRPTDDEDCIRLATKAIEQVESGNL